MKAIAYPVAPIATGFHSAAKKRNYQQTMSQQGKPRHEDTAATTDRRPQMTAARFLAILVFLTGCDLTTQSETIQVKPESTEIVPASDARIPPDADEFSGVSNDNIDLSSDDDALAVVMRVRVVEIIDGDTIEVHVPSRGTMRLRLNGIDAPELGQPFGKDAKQFLSKTIRRKMVRIVRLDVDRDGRTIADIYVRPDSAMLKLPEILVNHELVNLGLAWHFRQYGDNETLSRREAGARAAQLGLWSDPRHVAPWDWRKLSKEERDKLR